MPKKRYLWIYLTGWLMAMAVRLSAGTSPGMSSSYVVDEWDTDRGLPQNTVTSIVQTRDGYLWFGTLNGLVRFDGLDFKVFDEINTPGLESSRIHKVFEDSQGGLWLGTETAGFLRIHEGRVSKLGVGQAGFERRLASVCETTNGVIWLYTADGQVWRYASNHFEIYGFGLNRRSSCRVIMAEPSGPVWIGSDGRLGAIADNPPPGLDIPLNQEIPVNKLDFLLAGQKGGYWRLSDGHILKCHRDRVEQDFGTYPWGRAPVTSAVEDEAGNLLVGTLGLGVYRIGLDGTKVQLWSGQATSDRVVLSLCVDREGSLWIGTDGGGLKRLKKKALQIVDPSGGAESSVQSICADQAGGLWIGFNGQYVTYLNLKDGSVQRDNSDQGLLRVWSVYVDRQQRVWAGTYEKGLFLLQGGQFKPAPGADQLPRSITAIYQDRKGKLWLGTPNGLACWSEEEPKLFTGPESPSSYEVRALAEDQEGNLWIGTIGGGLYCLSNGRFSSYHIKDGLPSEDISALHFDADGILWMATPGKGLGRWDKGQGRWNRFTTADGLPSNSIGYLLEDSLGYFWMGSYAGILRVARQELNDYAQGRSTFIRCRAYGRQDGLPTLECTQGSQPGGWVSAQGQVWLPTVKGIVFVDSASMNPNPHPPPALIENVGIDNQLQNTSLFRPELRGEIIVPVGKESLDIYFTSLNLTGADRSRFRYRMAGHEKDWIEAGTSRVAHYSKLPPGRYEFQVIASNEDGLWNEQAATLAIWVQTPFWRTGWFLSLVALTAVGIITGSVHFLSTQKLKRQVERLKQQEALERERSRIAQDIHDQLGANLTQVTLLGEMLEGDKEDPAEVETHARQIIKTARETVRSLDEIVWAVNPTNDTLEGLMTYLFKQAQDFLNVAGLRYRLEVPTQLPASTIPPDVRHNIYMAFKEAITNVVRHAQATSVVLRLALQSDRFRLEIEDDGKGLTDFDEKAARLRNGLSGMRKRMAAIGGRFSMSPAPQRGVLVQFEAPLDY